jgi:hypothetical protein
LHEIVSREKDSTCASTLRSESLTEKGGQENKDIPDVLVVFSALLFLSAFSVPA